VYCVLVVKKLKEDRQEGEKHTRSYCGQRSQEQLRLEIVSQSQVTQTDPSLLFFVLREFCYSPLFAEYLLLVPAAAAAQNVSA